MRTKVNDKNSACFLRLFSWKTSCQRQRSQNWIVTDGWTATSCSHCARYRTTSDDSTTPDDVVQCRAQCEHRLVCDMHCIVHAVKINRHQYCFAYTVCNETFLSFDVSVCIRYVYYRDKFETNWQLRSFKLKPSLDANMSGRLSKLVDSVPLSPPVRLS